MAPQSLPETTGALNLGLAVVAASTAPLLLLDNHLTVIAASTSFCSTFQIDPESAPGCQVAALGDGEWNLPRLIALLKATGSGFADIEGYEIDLKREGRPIRRLVLNAKKLSYAGNGDVRLVLS